MYAQFEYTVQYISWTHYDQLTVGMRQFCEGYSAPLVDNRNNFELAEHRKTFKQRTLTRYAETNILHENKSWESIELG